MGFAFFFKFLPIFWVHVQELCRGGKGREGEREGKLKVGSIQESERKGEVCTLSIQGGSKLSLCSLPLPQWAAHEHKHVKLLVYVVIQT